MYRGKRSHPRTSLLRESESVLADETLVGVERNHAEEDCDEGVDGSARSCSVNNCLRWFCSTLMTCACGKPADEHTST